MKEPPKTREEAELLRSKFVGLCASCSGRMLTRSNGAPPQCERCHSTMPARVEPPEPVDDSLRTFTTRCSFCRTETHSTAPLTRCVGCHRPVTSEPRNFVPPPATPRTPSLDEIARAADGWPRPLLWDLTLRDFFAAAALIGETASDVNGEWVGEKLATKCYERADQMLAARNRAAK